jgi:hypothetical protein
MIVYAIVDQTEILYIDLVIVLLKSLYRSVFGRTGNGRTVFSDGLYISIGIETESGGIDRLFCWNISLFTFWHCRGDCYFILASANFICPKK